MVRFPYRPVRMGAIAAAAGVVATAGQGHQATGSVTIESSVGAGVTENLLMQTRIVLGSSSLGGDVASLSVPGAVKATGADGAGVRLPTALAPGGALSVPPDTNVSVDTSAAAPDGGPYEGVMLVLVQYN